MAVKDSIGGWKRNAHIFSIPKLCSTLKQFVGKTWENFAKSFGININCPIPSVILFFNNIFYFYNISLIKFISREFTLQKMVLDYQT